MAPDSLLIALTGATGFIGSWIARHLVDVGWRVRVLVRPGSEKRLPQLPLEVQLGSLEDAIALKRFLAGAQGVVHCAGRVRGLTQADFDAVNAEGTARLARLSATAAVSRLVLISSLAAREPHLSPYAASKRKGEELLAEEGKGLSWIVLRPPAVYGPGDREMRPLLGNMVRGVVPIIGPRAARFSLLYVEDLARAVVAALSSSQGCGRIFEIDDGKPGGYGWEDVAAIAAAYRAGPVLRLPVPEMLLRLLAQLGSVSARLTGRAPMLSPAKVSELRHPNWVCDNRAILQVLDWQPQVDFAAGLPLTLNRLA